MNRAQLTEKHSFANDAIFRLKAVMLTGQRFLKNLLFPTPTFTDKGQLTDNPVIAFSESELWNQLDNQENWILTAGKIENLRIAAKKIHGLEVRANETFSFWRHIGNPNFGQGYVTGREIREGCIVPTIAGGLCQLSNALYDAALKANFEIVERHRHTKVIKGSMAEQERDATVKWNYIDLRFRSVADFRIEVELTSDKLIVSFRGQQNSVNTSDSNFNFRQSDQLNDCYACGNFACYKHPDKSSVKQNRATTTFILDEKWPEYDAYIQESAKDADSFILPLKQNIFIKTDRYSWTAAKTGKTKVTLFHGLYRAIKLRLWPKSRNNVFELVLNLDRKVARAAAKRIPIESTHLVISQNLLPFVFDTGVLGGRTYDVLMTRLPLEKLHERLDYAFSHHPDSPTLNDFRAGKELIELENRALTRARQIITPHAEIAAIFKNKIIKLNWFLPSLAEGKKTGSEVLFPAAAVGRKGAYAVRRLATELQLNLTVSGETTETDSFWKDLVIQKFNWDFDLIGLVVYPTYIENQPRQILKAIAEGIPVITTSACGIDRSEQVEIVALNNFEQLKNEVIKHTAKRHRS